MTPALTDDRKRQINALLADIENDAIDKSEWLPRKSPPVNGHRAAMPDIVVETDCPHCNGAGATGGRRCPTCHGNKRVVDERWLRGEIRPEEIRYAQVHVRNVLNYLRERNVLDACHVYAAQTYEVWREILHAKFGMRKKVSYGRPREIEETTGIDEYGFILLVTRLGRPHQVLVEYAIDAFATEHQRFVADRNAKAYRDAFTRLASLAGEVSEEIRGMAPPTEEFIAEKFKKLVADMRIKR
jgi:hypothetical protein